MSATNKLLFFNKEGYPYNFTLNNDIWSGKIFFDPNSTDIFKSETMYVLEEVAPVEVIDNFDIVNTEIYNTNGMTISPYSNDALSVDDIIVVNKSDKFYTKWVKGTSINKKFPVSTVVSFIGGIGDFEVGKLFTVLQTKRNAIMVATETANSVYNYAYVGGFEVQSHRTITFPNYNNEIVSDFTAFDDMKISLVGSEYNDSVYEIESIGNTVKNIYDYELDGATTGDTIEVDVELLTERPLVYNGKLSIELDGSELQATFHNGKTSNMTVGSTFIVEDVNGEHLYDSNEYKIESFLDRKYKGSHLIALTVNKFIDDDSKQFNKYYMIYDSSELIIDEQDELIFFNIYGIVGNNNIKRTVMNIEPYPEEGDTYYIAQLNKALYEDDYIEYKIYKVLKEHEKNIAVVTPSISNTVGVSVYTRCMSTSNILTYKQDVTTNGIVDTIDAFVTRYNSGLNANGVNSYRVDTKLVIEGIYSGQEDYFNVTSTINNVDLLSENSYSDAVGSTDVYNIIVKEGDLTYETYDMSDDLAIPFYVDIEFDIFDDTQDYGFNISINSVDYYIEYNDDAGSTSNTNTTIVSFIDKWGTVLSNKGINIWVDLVNDTHLYIQGDEPNVDVYDFSVRVNKNSSYTTNDLTYNTNILVSSNYIQSDSNIFSSGDFTTGMVITVNGSSFPYNNCEYNIVGLFDDRIEISYQGPMYSENDVELNITSREYLRRPRESNDIDIAYSFRWAEDTSTDIFMYDLSGDNLIPWGNKSELEYTGVKPLSLYGDTVILNRQPNQSEEFVNSPYKQQTVFDDLYYNLERFDDDNASILPEPITLFLGYNSVFEGVHTKTLIMERVDDISYSGFADGIDLYFVINGSSVYINSTTSVDLLKMGFNVGRKISMKFDDNKPYTQELFEDWNDYTITDVTKTKITVEGSLSYLTTVNEEFNFDIVQLPEQIAQFTIYGETEAEDERLEANMKLFGISLTEEDEFIFKSSDNSEEGIDYRLLNRKRKEMLNVYPEIYNYVGSYKAIINAINFFGYTDLQIVEYYKDIDETSPLYNKLKRVVLPDLLDSTVDGYSYSEDLARRLKYKKTNLMNLTYKITDEEGNNVNLYSLDEVQVKLNGLKNWLRKWVVPINSNIRDITGVAENTGTKWRRFDASLNIISQKTVETSTAINFSYVSTRSFNDNWLVSVRFYTVNDFVPTCFDLKVVTYTKDDTGKLIPQQVFDVLKTDMDDFNFSMNWLDGMYDKFFTVETTYYSDRGIGISVDKMYCLEDGETYYVDEYKNYILINNNFTYANPNAIQDTTNVYIVDEYGNIYVIEKNIE